MGNRQDKDSRLPSVVKKHAETETSSSHGLSRWERGAHVDREIIRVGCAGWNIPRQSIAHFELEGSHLERYSRTFSCCEINSSFYRAHKYETWERWSASVPQDFRFSVKLPRTITHKGGFSRRERHRHRDRITGV